MRTSLCSKLLHKRYRRFKEIFILHKYRYLLKKLAFMIPILLLVSVVTFILVDCTAGDPARVMLQGTAGNPSDKSVELLQQELGLNQPKVAQYFHWLGKVVRLDFGNSYVSSRPVLLELMYRVPITLGIAALAIFIVLLISIPLGIFSALKQNSWLDRVIQLFSVLTVSVPAFWLGLGLLILFGVVLHSMNIVGGAVGLWIWVPAFAIALGYTGQYIGLLRDNMIDVLEKPYIKAAKVRGLSPFRVVVKHALKNAFLPLLTKLGITFGTFLGGTVIIESVFSINGLGYYMMESIKDKDIPVIQAFVLLISFAIVLLNLLVDLLYAHIDPRIQLR